MNKMTTIVILFVMASAIVAGCVGSKQQTISTTGGDVKVSQGSGGPDWCKVGTSITSNQQGQGEGQYSFIIKGLTIYKGQEVCEADATFQGGQSQGGQSGSMIYYFSKDSKYSHIIMKDGTGKIINEMDTNNPSNP